MQMSVFNWDNHAYFALNSQYTHSLPVRPLGQRPGAKVVMERDGSARELHPKIWCGEVEAGLFMTEDIDVVRNEWLQEGVVPRCSVSGVCKFTSVTRATDEGDCIVKKNVPLLL